MKKYILVGLFFVAIFFNVETAKAQRGCCSHHGGVAGCNEYGRTICNDGTLSPSCTCTSIINKEKPVFAKLGFSRMLSFLCIFVVKTKSREWSKIELDKHQE